MSYRYQSLIICCLLASLHAFGQAPGRDNPAAGKTTQNPPQIDYKKPGAPLPPFRVLLYEDSSKKQAAATPAPEKRHRKHRHADAMETAPGGKLYTERNLPDDANFFVMVFNPTCSHCIDETLMLEKNMPLFKKSRLIMLSTPMMRQYLHDFVVMQHVADYPQITVGTDSSRYMDNAYMYGMLPQINVYSPDHKLLRIYNGEVSVDSLKQYIQ